MPRQKKKPSIEEQLRNVIACATEQQEYGLAQKLIEILRGRGPQKSILPGYAQTLEIPEGISVGITKEEKA